MKLPKSLPRFDPICVWRAGLGDAGLLSLHALHALERADVIAHDAQASTEVLSTVRSGARPEHADKHGGKPSHSQGDISLRLIELARQGEGVLRLKGGDTIANPPQAYCDASEGFSSRKGF